jgi:hypothetical protein
MLTRQQGFRKFKDTVPKKLKNFSDKYEITYVIRLHPQQSRTGGIYSKSQETNFNKNFISIHVLK